MKLTLILSALATSLVFTSGASAAGPTGAANLTTEPLILTQMSWRCGKNNPQMWGTFGDGCLKARRKAKKNEAELVVPSSPGTTLMGN